MRCSHFSRSGSKLFATQLLCSVIASPALTALSSKSTGMQCLPTAVLPSPPANQSGTSAACAEAAALTTPCFSANTPAPWLQRKPHLQPKAAPFALTSAKSRFCHDHLGSCCMVCCMLNPFSIQGKLGHHHCMASTAGTTERQRRNCPCVALRGTGALDTCTGSSTEQHLVIVGQLRVCTSSRCKMRSSK